VKNNPKICLVDYKSGGNIFSVLNSLKSLELEAFISSDPILIEKAESIILPGVGGFESAMLNLKSLGLIEILKSKALCPKTPFLGICLGMQILFESSTESQDLRAYPGLEVFQGKVEKFDFKTEKTKLKIPHMGWNQVYGKIFSLNPLLKGIENESDFYFVHSYRVSNYEESEEQILKSKHGEDFISFISRPELKLYGCQFHPEKSAKNGLRLLENFGQLNCT
jgi:imidazole glycerol-phosphate synthase subunit HisH